MTLAQDSFASTPLFLDPARPSLFIFVLVYYIWLSSCKGFLSLSSKVGAMTLRAISVEALCNGLCAHGDQHSFRAVRSLCRTLLSMGCVLTVIYTLSGLCAHCAIHCFHVLCHRWSDVLCGF